MSFSVTILGSSGAVPAFGRFTSSQYLNVQNRQFLIDCGEGAQMQLLNRGIGIQKIQNIFISHLHGDHYLGLMGLLFSMHLQRKESDLHLYAPKGLDDIILLQLKHSRSALNFRLNFHELPLQSREVVYSDEAISVETIPLKHKIPCAGFLVREKTKPLRINKEKLSDNMLIQHIASLKRGIDVVNDQGNVLYSSSEYTLPPRRSGAYAYCSDTAFNEGVIDQIKGVDLLYHEATFMEDQKEKAHETLHSTAMEAGRIAHLAGVKQLLLGHFSARYQELEGLLTEALQEFPNTRLACEGETYNIEE